MTCSSAMYSDTATLTLKYHIWRITICLDARGVWKNRSENDRRIPAGGFRVTGSLAAHASKFSPGTREDRRYRYRAEKSSRLPRHGSRESIANESEPSNTALKTAIKPKFRFVATRYQFADTILPLIYLCKSERKKLLLL